MLKSTLIRKDTAMTGEISLTGFVLPVGGIKEKCMAAVRNKMKRVLIPLLNKPDIDELPKETKDNLEIIFVDNIRDVIKHSLSMEKVSNGRYDVRKANPKF